MLSLAPIVDHMTNDLMPRGTSLPAPLAASLHLFNRVHAVWKWQTRYFLVYNNTTNFKRLGAGVILNYVAGNSAITRFGAQTILVTRRVYECARQKVAVYHAWKNFKESICNQTIPQLAIHKHTDSQFLNSILGPSTTIWIKQNQRIVSFYIHSTAMKCFELFKELFKLSMRYLDVMEAFSLDITNQSAAVNEIFVHSSYLLDELCNNRAQIKAELTEKKTTIQNILNIMGSQWKAEDLIDKIGMGIVYTEKGYSAVRNACTKTENFARRVLVREIFTWTGYAPTWMLPEETGLEASS